MRTRSRRILWGTLEEPEMLESGRSQRRGDTTTPVVNLCDI